MQTFYRKVADTISGHKTVKQEELIRLLNPMLRGWAQYHSPVVAKQAYSRMESSGVSEALAVVEAAASAQERRVGETEVLSLDRRSALGVRCSRGQEDGRRVCLSCTRSAVRRSGDTKDQRGIQSL